MKPCIFCQIMAGALAANIVYENEHVCAFLDHRPLFPGHVLVVPREHKVTLPDVDPRHLPPLMEAVRLVARAVPRAMSAQGSFVACNNIVSQSVPHLHWHVIPRTKGDGLKGFFWPRVPYSSPQHQTESAGRIRSVILQEAILDYWFGPPGTTTDDYRQRWFAPDPAFKGEVHKQALAGEFQDWAAEPRGRLALIVLLANSQKLAPLDAKQRAWQLLREFSELGQEGDLTESERAYLLLLRTQETGDK